MKLYVGNLAYDVTEEELQQSFSAFGTVTSASLVKDKYSGESRGFAFVEMSSNEEGTAAIAGMNGKPLKNRNLVVNEARPKTEGDRKGGFGGGNRGGFGGNRSGFGGGGGRGGFGGGGNRGGFGGGGNRGGFGGHRDRG